MGTALDLIVRPARRDLADAAGLAAVLHSIIAAEFRGRGLGQRLAETTLAFARTQGYEKAVIYVLAHNEAGLAYYRGLGFAALGVLKRQTKIGGLYHDEVFLEMHLTEQGS